MHHLACLNLLPVSPQFLFWCGVIGLVYIYAGYPLLMVVLGRRRSPPVLGEGLPFDVLIASHGEGEGVGKKITQLLGQRDAEAMGRMIVVLDGPDPEADAALRSLDVSFPLIFLNDSDVSEGLPKRAVLVIQRTERRGKPACLNLGLRYGSAPWTIFMDVRQEPAPGCLAALQAHFHDPEVCVVSGNLELRADGEREAQGVGFYWQYEKWLRQAESRLGCVPGATGACYAMRREEGFHFAEDLVLDDVWGPMQACRQGGACRFESAAVVYDQASQSQQQERLRKRRTIGGVFQLAFRRPGWMLPGGHPFWFSFLSHKVLRLAGPLFLVFALGGAMAASVACPSYAWAVWLQLGGYLLAVLAPTLKGLPLIGRVAGVAQAFLVLNLTVISGFSDWISGRLRPDWTRAYKGRGAA